MSLASHAIVSPAAHLVTPECREAAIAAVVKWSETFIEHPHEIFGGLPICPFARAARLKETIRFEVRPFAVDDPLDAGGELLSLVTEFAGQTARDGLETLFVIHPDRAQPLRELVAFVERLNARMVSGPLRDFQVFEAHPDSQFRVGNVYTRRSPLPSFQVLSRELLKKGSDSLLGSQYYARFTPEMLRAVGMPR